jgi:hypothetical protein
VAEGTESRDVVGPTAGVVALAAALLPVVGAGIRWVAFQFGDVRPALPLALAADVPHLAAAAFLEIAPVTALAVPALYFVHAYRARQREKGTGARKAIDEYAKAIEELDKALDSDEVNIPRARALLAKVDRAAKRSTALVDGLEMTRWERALLPLVRPLVKHPFAARLLVGLYWLVLVLLVPLWPSVPVLGAGYALASALFWRAIAGDASAGRQPRLSIATAGLPILVLALTLGIAGGLTGGGVYPIVGDFRFTPTSGIADGPYAEVGRRDGQVYLRTCGAGPSTIVIIPDEAVQALTMRKLAKVRTRSLYDVLRGKRAHLGLYIRC